MGKQDKLISKLKQSKQTFKWNDLVTLLVLLGYEQKQMSGSRMRFVHDRLPMILLHKPHPENEIKGGALKTVKLLLKTEGVL